MEEIKFRGAGGHGAVVAAKILAAVATQAGSHAQAFAAYGARRRGGKVESYARIAGSQIPFRCKMYQPDLVVVMDESLLEDPETLSGLKPGGRVLVNTGKAANELGLGDAYQVHTVDATGIARRIGVFLPGGFEVINTAMLGALVGLLGLSLEYLLAAISAQVSKADKNRACAELGYREVKGQASREAGEPGPGPAASGEDRTPVFVPESMKRCNLCLNCYIFCPSLAIMVEDDPFGLHLDPAVCTRCGICLAECPREAIAWEGV